MIHSQAHILSEYLLAQNLVVDDQTSTVAYAVNVDFKPPTPHRVVVLYNTRGKMDGRDMRTGTMFTHPGIQAAVRAEDMVTARAQAGALVAAFDGCRRATVSIEDKNYRIDAINRVGDPINMGQEEGSTRWMFTINALLSLTEL